MELEKIGAFITQQRKEKEMTQKQLGEALGVSDKAISKWECGKGMPDVSIMLPLCQILDIRVNELLSGEHLTEEAYRGKAEENMVDLIKEKEKISMRQYAANILTASIGIITLVGVIFLLAVVQSVGDISLLTGYLIDIPGCVTMFAVVLLFLVSAGLLGDFGRGIKMFFMRRREYGEEPLQRSRAAVRLAGKTAVFCGIFESIYCVIVVMHQMESLQTLGPNLAVGLLGMFYGILVFLLLLPIQGYLGRMAV